MAKQRNTTRWLLLGIGFLAVLYLLFYFFGRQARSADFRSELVSFEKAAITRLRIGLHAQQAELRRHASEADSWEVLLADGSTRVADPKVIDEMLELLLTIEPSYLHAKTRTAWPAALLEDSTGLRIEAFDDQSAIQLDLYIGRTDRSTEGRPYTLVRLAIDSVSYVAEGVSAYGLLPDPNHYRPNQLVALLPDSIEVLRFENKGSEARYTLARGDSGWLLNTTPAQLLTNDVLYEYLFDLAALSSNLFADDFNPPPIADRLIEIQTKGGHSTTLSFYETPRGWISHSSLYEENYFRDSLLFEQGWKNKSFFLFINQN